ncbi:hypothetical protein TVAG_045750 [Trichomonas vaginalis G3]|uniref:Uncharacterized protein n=1 Tax=Trichomonas vaginalis (strain ATCC PRA-98 / G3) TaxID=412133 RepID=A2DME6_TRIV3|nr:hypothetical protein TVAGG3_0604690 [Trichomonas vaginalis G3]EAY18373.1 hypothetical protein TVAG_045750 [Trichomonas vaginalis G3]KAI5524162.1 hypothetical protein TVAGG3_0604690 [Trichomonas vaginalis G3]|eukprot:XP_001579359.1 hypothetical protein [Trichomonas vaginalis G3]
MFSSEGYSRSESDRQAYSSRASDHSKANSDTNRRNYELDPPEELYPRDQVWSPLPGFPGLLIAVDEKGTLVISGPKEYLDVARAQIRQIVYQKLGYDVTNDIRTLQFEEQL